MLRLVTALCVHPRILYETIAYLLTNSYVGRCRHNTLIVGLLSIIKEMGAASAIVKLNRLEIVLTHEGTSCYPLAHTE